MRLQVAGLAARPRSRRTRKVGGGHSDPCGGPRKSTRSRRTSSGSPVQPFQSIVLPHNASASGRVPSSATCSCSLWGSQTSSASRNATSSPRACRSPRLRAALAPRFACPSCSSQRMRAGSAAAWSRAICVLPSDEPSSHSRSSQRSYVCARTLSIDSVMNRAESRKGMTTETRGRSFIASGALALGWPRSHRTLYGDHGPCPNDNPERPDQRRSRA